MHFLNIHGYAHPDLENKYDVYWTLKAEGCNYMEVTLVLPSVGVSPIVLAEMFVAHHLLSDMSLLGGASGQQFSLNFGHQETVDMFSGSFSPYNMLRMFNTRFEGLLIQKSERFLSRPGYDDIIERKQINFDRWQTDTIDTPALGKVVISEHGLKRFIERGVPEHDKPKIRSPYKSLVQALMYEGLVPVTVNAERISLMKRLARGIDKPEDFLVFKDPRKDLHFLLSPKDEFGESVMVSAFIRSEKHYVQYRKSVEQKITNS